MNCFFFLFNIGVAILTQKFLQRILRGSAFASHSICIENFVDLMIVDLPKLPRAGKIFSLPLSCCCFNLNLTANFFYFRGPSNRVRCSFLYAAARWEWYVRRHAWTWGLRRFCCRSHIASAKFNFVYFFVKAPVPCYCLNCPSADIFDSSGCLLCHVSACIDSLRILMILLAICCAVFFLA